MKTKLLLLAFLMQLFALNASAYDALVGGIYYNLDTTNRTASVTHGSSKYTGIITIPTTFTYNNIDYRVTSSGGSAFSESKGLISVSLPLSIADIGIRAFYGCTSLDTFDIPSSVTSIRREAFSGCTQLVSISIPESVTFIERDAFLDTPWYNTWYDNKPNGLCYINDNVLYKYKGNTPEKIVVNDGTVCIGGRAFEDCNLETIVIPQSVTSICSYAFSNCYNLKSIIWHKDLQLDYLGAAAFHRCIGLKTIEVPAFSVGGEQNPSSCRMLSDGSISTSGNYHFYGCNGLESAYLAEGQTEVFQGMFKRCTNLTTLYLPSTIKKFGLELGTPFDECENLTVVYANMARPVEINSETFSKRYVGTLYVPKGSKAAYQSAEYWGDFKEIIEMVQLQKITLPESIELTTGESTRLTATIVPENATNKDLKWESSDETVAVVEDGIVTAKGEGSATITASATDGSGVSATCKVTVGDPGPTPIDQLDNIIYLGTAKAGVGAAATLSFNMKNTAAIRGFQFDLYLPEGITAVKNAKGRIQASLSSGRLPEDDEHTLTVTEQTDGAIRFLCGSQYDETFTGNEGELLTLQVNIDETIPDGDYPVILKEMRLSETDINKYYDTKRIVSILTLPLYILGDINVDGVINVSDYIGIANHILGIPQEGFIEKAGDVNEDNVINVSDYIGLANFILTGSFYGASNVKAAFMPARVTDLNEKDNVIFVEPLTISGEPQEATLSIQMKNTAAIRGFQFDLYLPEGVTAVKNAKGRIQASLSNGRLPEDDEHTLTVQSQADGAIRFLCGSQYDETFTGTSGEIATLKVNIAEGLTDGSYPIVLKNMRLSETDITKYYDWDEVETTMTVDLIENIKYEMASGSQFYNLSGQFLTQPQRGVNIIHSADGTTRKVLVK